MQDEHFTGFGDFMQQSGICRKIIISVFTIISGLVVFIVIISVSFMVVCFKFQTALSEKNVQLLADSLEDGVTFAETDDWIYLVVSVDNVTYHKKIVSTADKQSTLSLYSFSIVNIFEGWICFHSIRDMNGNSESRFLEYTVFVRLHMGGYKIYDIDVDM